MSIPEPNTLIDDRLIAYDGHRRVAAGSRHEVALALKRALDAGASGPLLVFDATSSRTVELDLRGSEADVLARLARTTEAAPVSRGPGRPKLGVTAREVTLLPRHWAWLADQPGGASAFLRRLVEQAMRADGGQLRSRQAAESVDRFMLAMTGDLPGHEEVSRALWRNEPARFNALTETWPVDVRDHLRALAAPVWCEHGTDR